MYEFSADAPLRPPRCKASDVRQGGVLVVDNGSYYCRAGWAGQAEPSVAFRALLHRPRAKNLPDGASIVGDYDTSLLRGVDTFRSTVRSAFEANVPITLEVQEAVLDHAFERLGLRGGRVAHPLLLTEPLLAPPSARARLAELAFETYGVPSLAFGVDAAFAWCAAAGAGRVPADAGVVAAAGHTACHVLPLLDGSPLPAAAVRLAPGGLAVSEHLGALLAARYRGFAPFAGRAEELKHALCHVALAYGDEARAYAQLQLAAQARAANAAPDGDADATGSGGRVTPGRLAGVQLPWLPTATSAAAAPLTAEELARKEERRKAAGDRLRAMAAARRAAKAEERAAEVAALEAAVAAVQSADASGDGDAVADALAEAGFTSEEALVRALGAAAASLRKLRGGGDEEEDDVAAAAAAAAADDTAKYPLLNVPDSELSPEQLKAKRRQRLLKGGEEARARARAAKAAAAAAEAAEAEELAQRFAAEPDALLAELRAARAAVEARVESRRARRLGRSAAAPPRRGGDAQRERMRLMAVAASDAPPPPPPGRKRKGGAGDAAGADTFGMDDADWDVYRQMDRDGGSDSEAERADEAALARLGARLADFEAQRGEAGGGGGEWGGDASQAGLDPNTPEAHQMWLGVERIRAPEILFQPMLAGIDQAGLAEAVLVALRRAPTHVQPALRAAPLLLTGGAAAMPGFAQRMQAELTAACEPGHAMPVVLSSAQPWLDAWRGASLRGVDALSSRAAISAAEWAEAGAACLRRKPQLRYA